MNHYHLQHSPPTDSQYVYSPYMPGSGGVLIASHTFRKLIIKTNGRMHGVPRICKYIIFIQ